jgi:hypothetical protein
MVVYVTETADRPGSRPATTAHQWQRTHGQTAIDWMRSSGAAQRMLDDICIAVTATAGWMVGDDPEMARQVIEQYPQVLSRCDDLHFHDEAQALAYLILHLPDRYTRMFQVLECLLLGGMLPVGKSDSFAVIDIGAGPGPCIFAIRNFYAALAHYARANDPDWTIATLGHAHVVERGNAMPWIMHNLAEALLPAERVRQGGGEAHPCAAELERSQPPFFAHYADFSDLDVRAAHQQARRRLAYQLTDDDWWGYSPDEVNQIAYHGPIYTPSSYALAVMMNFLTTIDAVPRFSDAIERLMRGSLVPGGTIIVLGAVGHDYPAIYAELDRRARAARLTVLDGFDEPLQAGHRSDELAAIRTLTRGLWNRLEGLAGDVDRTKEALRELEAADIFDESIAFRLPRFRARAYRRGR